MIAAEQKLKELLCCNFPETGTSNETLQVWFLQQFKAANNSESCNLEEFALYFLDATRQQVEIRLRSQESETLQCQSPVRTHKLSPTKASDGGIYKRLHEQWNTAEIQDASFHNTSLERNFSPSFESTTSTPVRRTTNPNHQRRSAHSISSAERSSARNSSASTSLCLGDFLVLNTSSNTRSTKKKTPQQQQSMSDTQTGKPKKRVVPTSISNYPKAASTLFGGCSSFSNDNNILKITDNEVDDKSKCSIMEARKFLRLNAKEISKEMQENFLKQSPLQSDCRVDKQVMDVVVVGNDTAIDVRSTIDLEKVTSREVLQKLADIYAVLIDMNLTTYILNEISFLINLLNVNQQQEDLFTVNEEMSVLRLNQDISASIMDSKRNVPNTQPSIIEGLKALSNVTNCAYFALRVLNRQRSTLALLDSKSIGVLLHSECISYLDPHLKSYLESVHRKKQQLDLHKTLHNNSLRFGMSFKNVYYREEDDARHNFSSNNEFAAFKTQRDIFYKALKLWEENHLNKMWCFSHEITPKIREIFKRSENPINMAQFAKLFVSQLLISAMDTSSPSEIGLEIDLQKFSKLTQRLVAPSNFSVDYQFPRNQAFFRDFILEGRSVAFTEQLKMAFYQELITLNDSTFEELKLITADRYEEDVTGQNNGHIEFIVCPEILASMLILAKFLGFITAQPFNQICNASFAANIEKKQLMLRSLFEPDFNAGSLLLEAIKKRKLLITLPWLVQYFAMLDNITLQLAKFVEATQIMFALYENFVAGRTTLFPTSIFVVRCCLGWLFDAKPIISEQYYSYRLAQTSCSSKEVLNSEDLNSLISSYLVKQSPCALSSAESTTDLNVMLESILNVACPFLAEFRVSIMPAKYAMIKNVSRSGRYRHITTRVAELSTTQIVGKNAFDLVTPSSDDQRNYMQKKLIDAFLDSQNVSMRRLIEFVMERVYKSVVKDAQYKILLPSKNGADGKVNAITSHNMEEVAEVVEQIYDKAREEALKQWDTEIPQLMNIRIKTALDALLPAETAWIIKKTYSLLIRRNAVHKVQLWRNANMAQNNNFYCSNLEEVAQKICKANRKEKQELSQSSELNIIKDAPGISDLIDDLQYWLHCTSMRPDLFPNAEPLTTFMQQIPMVFENTLPTIFYRLVGAGIIQLLQHVITRHPSHLTTELLEAACVIWLTPEIQNTKSQLKVPHTASTGENVGSGDGENVTMPYAFCLPNIFDELVTISFIESLGTRNVCFDKLKALLIALVRRHVITVDFVNELFVPIFKEDWHSQTLNEISNMLQAIAQEHTSTRGSCTYDVNLGPTDDEDDGKSRLFMEVLAEFSRNVDNY